MSNIKNLQDKINEMKDNGLIDISVSTGNLTGATTESLAGELLALIDAVESGAGRRLRFNDSKQT